MKKKISVEYYVLMHPFERMYFNGFINPELWVNNLEFCYFTDDLFKAKEVKKMVAGLYGVDCKIIKINLLEVE